MTDAGWGRVLVAMQFLLIATVVFIPRGSSWAMSEPIVVLAFTAIVIGVVIVVTALITLGKSLSANPVPLESGQLKTSGIFRLVRHPVYSGIMVGAAGYAVMSRSWFVVLTVVALVVLFAIKARFEEKLLLAKYGDYLHYANRVGRFFPGVGKIRGQSTT